MCSLLGAIGSAAFGGNLNDLISNYMCDDETADDLIPELMNSIGLTPDKFDPEFDIKKAANCFERAISRTMSQREIISAVVGKPLPNKVYDMVSKSVKSSCPEIGSYFSDPDSIKNFLEKVGDWNRFNENSGGTFVEKCCHFFDLMRLIIKADPVRIMASAGQEVNHLDERYDGRTPDIWDCGYVIVDFANGKRALLELSMFAEGSEYQEMVHAIGPKGKLEVKLPGPGRLWSGDEDKRPIPILIESPRVPCNPITTPYPIDETILAAGDHNGSTYHQHEKFLQVVRGTADVEVTLDDGIWAVRMGMAAQESARTGQAVTF